MKNTYILDTSVIVHNPEILSDLNNSKIIIPIIVLEELDKLKNQYNLTGAHARQFLKILDSLTENYDGSIALDNESTLIIDTEDHGSLGKENSYGDNKILACAQYFNYNDKDVILLTRDYNLRIRARVLKIKSENYSKELVMSDSSEFYTGIKEIEMESIDITSLYDNDVLCVNEDFVKENKLFPNQYLLLKAKDNSVSAACRFYEDFTIKLLDNKQKAFGLSSKNKEQTYALDALFDDNVKLVTLSGPAGTGKSLLCIAAALEQVINQKKYEKIVITKSIETVGKDIGALPGTKLEKMAPFVQSVMDNVSTLFKSKKKGINKKPSLNKKGEQKEELIEDPYLSMLIDSGVIEVEAIAYMRGRSIDNAIVIIEECQNISIENMKTICTRIGNSKILCNGDLDQIDSSNLNIFNNGFTHLIENMKPYAITAHVTLNKGERSELATLASKVL